MFASSKVVRSQVWLSDLRAYAESDPDDEPTMASQVELTEFKEQVGARPLLEARSSGDPERRNPG